MAYEIIVSPTQFQFIFQTDIYNMEDLKTFVWALYNDAEERLEAYDGNGDEHDLPALAEYIPTKAMILDTADMEFTEKYMHHIMRFEDTGFDYLKEELEEGDWSNIHAMLEEMRYNSGTYYMGMQDGDPELEYARDIIRGMQFFQLTYLDDMVGEDFYKKHFTEGYEWINPPIVKVW